MKQCTHGIDGLQSTNLSSSARPFAMVPSSSSSLSLKSETEDSIWRDYTLDLSFLSSDEQRSGFDVDDDDSLSNLSRDVETTTKEACSGNVLVNSDQVFLKLPEVLIKSSKVVGGDGDKLDLSCVKTTVLSEKSSDQDDDSEEDSPCWRGMHSHKTLASGTKSAGLRRSIDDLNGFFRLNPLAPHFVPSSSKKKVDMDGEKCEENGSSSSLKKSLSSTFPSSLGEFDLIDTPLEDGIGTSILSHNADEMFGFVSPVSVSNTVSLLDSRNDFQTSKKLDPLAPVFVPSSTKLSPSVHEKQGAFEANALSTSVLTSSDDKSLNKVNVERRSGEVGRSIKIGYPDSVHESGSTSSFNPWVESKVGITEYAKPGSFSNKSHGQQKLNPLAPQFSFANTNQNSYERNQVAKDLSLVVNTAGLSSPTGYWDHNVYDSDLPQSSVYVKNILPNISPGSSSLISPKVEKNFGSTKWFAVEPKPTLSGKGNKALSGPPPKMDVKKLLTTMHGLSELLTLAHGSEPSDSRCVEEFDLINSTVQNLNLYMNNNIQEQVGIESIRRRSSYDLKLSPNRSKLSIRDLQLSTGNSLTVDLDVKRKDQYSMVSREMVPESRMYQYGTTRDNGFGQVVAKSGCQQNHQGEEQINQHALFYKSLWLKAEADRCLMVYETSLSNPNP